MYFTGIDIKMTENTVATCFSGGPQLVDYPFAF
jgi:hypothetical protein